MNFPAFESFRNIEMNDWSLILAHNEKYSPFSCEYGFGCLYIYAHAYGLKYTIFDDRLFVLDENEKCLYMPIGKPLGPESLKEMIVKYRERIPDIFYALFSLEYIKSFPELRNHFDIVTYRNECEYLYSTAKMAELRGGSFLRQRNLISNFRRHYYDYTVEPVSCSAITECMQVAETWAEQKGLCDDEDIIKEHKVIERLFTFWDKTGLEGALIKTGGSAKAFAIFSRLDKTTYVIHIEKFDRSIKGLPQTLNIEVAGLLRDKCEYINREQDVGLEGLRYSKMSYQPEKIIDVYCLIPKF